MKIIEKMLEQLMEEVEGAKEYAEKYIECKARGNMVRANRYKEMAGDELKHAGYLRDFDVADLDELKKVYTMSDEEESEWEHGHRRINEQMAIVKNILSM